MKVSFTKANEQIEDGEKTVTRRKMEKVGLLPPPPDCCQTCARQHEPGEPHDQQSFYYRFVFYNENGRSPTWFDAMNHCADDVKEVWVEKLAEFGVIVEPPAEGGEE